jgi:hypothetical protein
MRSAPSRTRQSDRQPADAAPALAVREVEVVDWFSTSATPGRLVLVGAILVAIGLVPWVGRGLVTFVQGVVDVIKILVTGKVLTDLAKLEPDQAERLRGHLDRVRPPPDELQPPTAS